MSSLAAAAQSFSPGVGKSPWPGHEYVRGYTVFSMPTSTGDVLVLRVLPENDFAPYTTVWRRSPAGRWSMFVDAADIDTACPRYFGSACREILPASIVVTWPGPSQLHVEVRPAPRPSRGTGAVPPPPAGDRPRMSWTVRLAEPAPLRVLNAMSAVMPRYTWKPDVLVRGREWMARRLLGMGHDMRLRVTTPSGHLATLCPRRIAFVADSHVVLDGSDLGVPQMAYETPTIGTVPLAVRPTFAVGEGFFLPPRLPPPPQADRRARTPR